MRQEDLGDFTYFHLLWVRIPVWLLSKLTDCTFRTINHYKGTMSTKIYHVSTGWKPTPVAGSLLQKVDLLHNDPSPNTSAIKLEQFLESRGPPPEHVPRKVTDIS